MKHTFHYTLIEVLVAVAVLALMMSFLFQFTGSAQRIWRASSASMDIASSSDTVFALLDEDLSQMVVDADAGLKYENAGGAFTFYTVSNAAAGALVKVCYKYNSTDKTLFRFQEDVTYDSVDNLEPKTVTFPAEADDYLVAEGIEGFVVTAYPADPVKLPNYIHVKLTLVQTNKSESDNSKDECVFSRVFFLGMK